MSYADIIFKENAKEILEHGTSTEGQKVRPHWPDGTPAYWKKVFGVVNRYDLRKEFPLLTLRKTAFKSCVNEILWIYQKASNNVHDLNSTIWDEWADETGSIGKAYGYQIAQKVQYKEGLMNQMEKVIYDLKHTPYNRRIMTDIYNIHDLPEMHLAPCCYGVTYNVTDEGYDKPILNMILNQRSNDMMAANNWNVAQYAALLTMVAYAVDMIPGELVHVIADQHIYDRHIPLVEELLTREPYPAPIVTFHPETRDFWKFSENDFTVENYQTHPQITGIEIAI